MAINPAQNTYDGGSDRIPVLMYHRVGTAINDWERKYCVSPELFSEHMHNLAHHGLHPCSIDEFVAWLSGKTPLAEKSFLITFDDGFYGVYEHAMPVLAELEWPATVFLVSSLIGKTDIWCQRENPSNKVYPLLGREHIFEMRKHGFSFHSHSRSHADLTMTPDHTLRQELFGAKCELEDLLGSNVPYLAYPYGHYDERVLAITREAGYQAAFSVQPGFNRPGLDPYRIRRLDVFGTDTSAQLLRKVSLGTNDGSWINTVRYYISRFTDKIGLGSRT
jgi:peptidoglycan/xylan/chitin deacetylase (PgdA/CDA1 family)